MPIFRTAKFLAKNLFLIFCQIFFLSNCSSINNHLSESSIDVSSGYCLFDQNTPEEKFIFEQVVAHKFYPDENCNSFKKALLKRINLHDSQDIVTYYLDTTRLTSLKEKQFQNLSKDIISLAKKHNLKAHFVEISYATSKKTKIFAVSYSKIIEGRIRATLIIFDNFYKNQHPSTIVIRGESDVIELINSHKTLDYLAQKYIQDLSQALISSLEDRYFYIFIKTVHELTEFEEIKKAPKYQITQSNPNPLKQNIN